MFNIRITFKLFDVIVFIVNQNHRTITDVLVSKFVINGLLTAFTALNLLSDEIHNILRKVQVYFS